MGGGQVGVFVAWTVVLPGSMVALSRSARTSSRRHTREMRLRTGLLDGAADPVPVQWAFTWVADNAQRLEGDVDDGGDHPRGRRLVDGADHRLRVGDDSRACRRGRSGEDAVDVDEERTAADTVPGADDLMPVPVAHIRGGDDTSDQ